MAKRFTDTNKYKKPFIRGLLGAYKIFWDYLYHSCDHAGIWIVDFEIAQIYVGNDMPINEADALKYFNIDEIRILVIADGKKWFIIPFIQFQYGELNPANRAHKSVLVILSNNNIKPLIYTLQGCKDKDKDKDKDMVKDKVKVTEGLSEYTIEQVNNEFFKQGLTDADAEKFFNHYKSQGWLKGNGLPVLDLAAQVTNWRLNPKQYEVKEDDKQAILRKACEYDDARDKREGTGIMASVNPSGIVAPDENLF